MSASMALAHRVSVHVVMGALSFVHMPKAHYIQNTCTQLCLLFFPVTLGKLCSCIKELSGEVLEHI